MPIYIYSAQFHDNQIVKRFEHFESNYTLGNRFNGLLQREKRNASRRAGTHRKATSVASARVCYAKLEDQLRELAIKRQKSLDRKKQIEQRLVDIQAELNHHSNVSMIAANLKAEKAALKKEERKGIDERKDWSAAANALKDDMKKLKENELQSSRVRDSRPLSSSPAPSISAGEFEEPDDLEPDPRDDSARASAQPEISTSTSDDRDLTSPRFTGTPVKRNQLRHQSLEPSSPIKSFLTDFSEADQTPHWQSEWDAPFDFEELNDMPPSDYSLPEDILLDHNFSNPLDSEQLDAASLAIMDRFLELYPEDV